MFFNRMSAIITTHLKYLQVKKRTSIYQIIRETGFYKHDFIFYLDSLRVRILLLAYNFRSFGSNKPMMDAPNIRTDPFIRSEMRDPAIPEI